MNLSIIGKFKKLGNIQNPTPTFSKRRLMIETQDGDYKKDVVFELIKTGKTDRLELADNFKEGDSIEVFFNLHQRENKGNWFTTLQPWKVAASGNGENNQQSAPDESF